MDSPDTSGFEYCEDSKSEIFGFSDSPEIPEKRSTRRNSISAMFELPAFKKRKRKVDDDALSVQSLDITLTKKKSRRSILRVSSLVNLLSPNKPSSKRFKVPSNPARQNISPYKAPQPSPAKRRLTRTWSDMMADGGSLHTMTNRDIKRQEAIYELYQGELDIIEDLNNVQKNYHDSMAKLQLMTNGELKQIFGPIKSLPKVHEDLVSRLQKRRLPDGTTQGIGREILEWISSLDGYIGFCSNQVFGKALLDEKKSDPSVDDFLQRCQESPFSRKLDLWSLLDGARSRFVKYPLLIRSILKYTSEDNDDAGYLQESIKLAEFYIAEADKQTGEAKCRYYQSRITYLYDDQRLQEIDDSHSLICSGVLKNNKGSKLHLFLFDKVLIATRLTNQSGCQMYQVYRQPIPVDDLSVEDLMETEVKMGSFRSAFSQSQTVRNVFKISFKDTTKGQSHTLLANDEHDKRQWLQCFRQVTDEVHTIAPTHSDKRAA